MEDNLDDGRSFSQKLYKRTFDWLLRLDGFQLYLAVDREGPEGSERLSQKRVRWTLKKFEW